MKTKTITSLVLSILTLVLLTSAVSAATLSEWALTTNGVASNVNANIVVTNFIATGVTVSGSGFDATDGTTYSDWPTTSSSDPLKYYSFNVTPNSGYVLSLSDLSFSYRTSNGTVGSFVLQYSKNAGFTSPVTIVTKTDISNVSANYSNTALDIQVNAGETLYFRLFGYGFANAADLFNVKTLKLGGEAVKTFCPIGSSAGSSTTTAGLELKKVDVSNNGEGSDDEWLALDNIEVEVKFKNIGTEDLDNIVFKLGLFNEDGEDIAEDLDWTSKNAEEIEVGDVDEGDDITHIFKFRIDPSEIESGKYKLMIKAFPDGEEDTSCVDYVSSTYYTDVKIEEESDKGKMVVVDVDSLPQPIEALCGQEITFTADVYNIGSTDFLDQIKVVLKNTELGLDLGEVILGDLDAGDKTTVTFTFRVPANAAEKTYSLSLKTYYDYDEDDEEYDEVSDDEFLVSLKVKGGCVFDPKVTITAALSSGGKAGEEMVVKATVTNTDSSSRTFTLGVSGIEAWGKLVSLSSETLTLAAGESKEVTITLTPNADAEGEKEFSLDLTTADGKVIPQSVEVLVEKAGFSLLTGDVLGGKNWYIWGIGALNIVLILIIILVAVRLVKK